MRYYTTYLRRLRVKAQIGIHEHELAGPQAIFISVVLLLEHGDLTDRIEDVVDYDFLRDGINDLTRTRRFNLQETLCAALLDLCLAEERVAAALVTTEKPEVYPDTEAVGCRMLRARPGVDAAALPLLTAMP